MVTIRKDKYRVIVGGNPANKKDVNFLMHNQPMMWYNVNRTVYSSKEIRINFHQKLDGEKRLKFYLKSLLNLKWHGPSEKNLKLATFVYIDSLFLNKIRVLVIRKTESIFTGNSTKMRQNK